MTNRVSKDTVKIICRQDRPCYVEIYRFERTGRLRVAVHHEAFGWADYPLQVDGKILYDFPERVPVYAKRMVKDAFKRIERGEL